MQISNYDFITGRATKQLEELVKKELELATLDNDKVSLYKTLFIHHLYYIVMLALLVATVGGIITLYIIII